MSSISPSDQARLTGATGLALLTFEVGFELAEQARAETDRRKQWALIRAANKALDAARWLDSTPDNYDPEAWDAWIERAPGKAKVKATETDRVAVLEAELAELRAELANRDVCEVGGSR